MSLIIQKWFDEDLDAPVSSVVIITELVGSYTWVGKTSSLAKLIGETVGTYTWVGKTSSISKSIVSTVGQYTWLGKTSSFATLIAESKGTYTWAGTQSSLAKLIAESVGAYTWVGKTASFGDLITVNAAQGIYVWLGKTSTISTGASGSTIVFFDGLNVADGLTYHKGLSRPTVQLTPVGDGTYTVVKSVSLSDEKPDSVKKQTVLIDGDLP